MNFRGTGKRRADDRIKELEARIKELETKLATVTADRNLLAAQNSGLRISLHSETRRANAANATVVDLESALRRQRDSYNDLVQQNHKMVRQVDATRTSQGVMAQRMSAINCEETIEIPVVSFDSGSTAELPIPAAPMLEPAAPTKVRYHKTPWPPNVRIDGVTPTRTATGQTTLVELAKQHP